ncbi:MAG TPA: hypothetical protein VM884_02830 [Flavisolibacter sp.]|nr:hypothetical protein [Flavisolibacter sp.]
MKLNICFASLLSPKISGSTGGPATNAFHHIFDLTLTGKGGVGDSTWIDATVTAAPADYTAKSIRLNDKTSSTGSVVFVYSATYGTAVEYVLPSLMVEGTTYSQLVVYEKSDVPKYRCAYYWAPNVGIVRIRKFEKPLSIQRAWTYNLLWHN